SSWPLCPGLHTCYNGGHKPLQTRKREPIGKSLSQFGSESATRLREAGIASNRGSACRGEYVPGSCTHRPSHHESGLYPKAVQQPRVFGLGERADHGKVSDWGEVVTR